MAFSSDGGVLGFCTPLTVLRAEPRNTLSGGRVRLLLLLHSDSWGDCPHAPLRGKRGDVFPGQGQLYWRSSFKTALRAPTVVARTPCCTTLDNMPVGVSGGFLDVPAGTTPVRLSKFQAKSFPSPRGNLGATHTTPELREESSCYNTV